MIFLKENISTIVISLILLILFIIAIRSLYKKKSGCHGGCADCPYCDNCHTK